MEAKDEQQRGIAGTRSESVYYNYGQTRPVHMRLEVNGPQVSLVSL